MTNSGSTIIHFTRGNKIILGVIMLAAFVLYGNSIRNEYNIDDFLVISGNKYVAEGVKGIPDILTHWYAENKYYKLDYRPVALISFAFEKQFFDLNVHVSHFFNILFYTILLLLVYTLLVKTFRLDQYSEYLPLLITLLYAAHPAHTEIVCSLKNRDELFAHIFGFLFIYYVHKTITSAGRNYFYGMLSLIFLGLAYVSKLTSLPFIGIASLMLWYYGVKKNKIAVFFTVLSLVITVAYVYWVTRNFNREYTFYENPLSVVTDLSTRLGTGCYVLAYHVRFLFFPFPLRFYYGYNIFPVVYLNNPEALASFFFHLLLFVFALFIKRKNKDLSFFILAYLISISMYSNIFTYTGMFSERAILLSSLWFCVLIAWAGIFIIKKYPSEFISKMSLGFLLLMFSSYSYITICRNFQWKNSITLMDHDIRYLKESTLANLIYANNLAKEYNNRTDSVELHQLSEKALRSYDQAIRTAPNYAEPYFQLANFYKVNLMNNNAALSNFQKAVDLESGTTDYVYGLAKQYFDMGDHTDANNWFRRNYELNARDSSTLFYYAQTADLTGDVELSKNLNRELLQKFPDTQYPYLNIGTYYTKNNKIDSAAYYYAKAIEYGCRNPKLMNDLANYFHISGQTEKEDYYRKLLKELP